MLKMQMKDMVTLTVKNIELFLAVAVILSVLIYVGTSFQSFVNADWGEREVFYDLIYRVLLVTIALELARMLITHSFLAILELLAFVVARKMLKPDITTMDVLLGVFAFVVLLAANRYFVLQNGKSKIESNG